MQFRHLLSVLLLVSPAAQSAVINFDDNVLAPDTYFDPQANVTWSSGDATFTHGWNDTFNCCWDGFTYSNSTDTTTAGFLNDRSAITGDGIDAGQDNYAIGYTGNGTAALTFAGPQLISGGWFTNSTYSYLAMAFGDDGNDPAFVKGPFGEGDFFELTVTGLNEAGDALGTATLLLADGADVLDSWAWLDLSGLGAVYGLRFSLDSSDQGSFGMNTPAYFAMDGLQTTAVPLPAAAWFMISALAALGFAGRRTGKS